MNFGIFIWFLFKTSGHLGACTKQIENRAEKLKLEIPIYLLIDFIYMYYLYIIFTRILLRTQKCIIHGCMLSVKWSMTIFVLNFGGQLVHLDMATRFWTSSRGRPGFESGLGNVHVCITVDWCNEVLHEGNCLTHDTKVSCISVQRLTNDSSDISDGGGLSRSTMLKIKLTYR